LAGSVAKASALGEMEQKQSGSGKIASAEDKATPVKVGPQDVVKLSAGDNDASKTAKDASKAFDSKIVALQEETSAREKSLKDAKERTAALEKQIQDMQKLLALKSQSMTQLQKNSEVVAKAPDVKTEALELAKTQEATKVEVLPTAQTKTLEEAPAVIPEIKKAKPAHHAKTPQQAPVPQPEPSFLEGLMNSVDLAVLGGASGVALLGAGWMYLRNKRRKDLDSFERGILTSGGLRANTVFGNTTGNASTSDTSFLTDFSQNADGSMIDTNDVDPIAEAEVYMAYGRDAQAEEILKDAITKEPKRYELHLKLLEMYAGRKDTAAFETIAGELYTTLGANNPTWAKVAEMGAVLEPENPLYAVSNIAATDALTTQKSDEEVSSSPAASANSDLDFSFNTESEAVVEDANSAVMQSFSEDNDNGQEISFDLGTLNAGSDIASLSSIDSDKSVIDSTSEEDITFESADVNPPVESTGSHDAFSSNADADNSMDFDLGDLTTEVSVATVTPVESAVLSVTNDSPAIDAGMMANDNFSAIPLDPSVDSERAGSESPEFDLNFVLPTEDVKSEPEHQPEVASNPLDDISFDLDFALDEPVASMPVKQADNDDMEISFDLPESPETKESVTSNSAASQEDNHEANTFDLSSISLDLGETESELFAEAPSPTASSETEPQDVNVKLDLVAAYIDMDDKEGARELLEEVMKEGGNTQKVRAQQLLDSLA
jgi:pilus assembly protein FimV